MKKLLTTTVLFLALSANSQHQIGHITKTFVDVTRNNRSIQTEIYYPAATAGNNAIAVQEEFPVIVFGHGFVMAWDAYQNIWEELVPKGYILVFPRTEGNAFSTDHQKFGWDLQFLVTEMQAEGALSTSLLYNVIHPNTALMGHSMGGGASFLAADSLCANGNSNLKTLVGLAPAESSTNGVSSIASANNITVPSLILSGVQDGVTPPMEHHIPMYNALASNCKTILHVTGGAHCYFANSNAACDFGESTASSGISISRLEQQQILYDFVTPWLDFTLKSSCGSLEEFQDSVAQSTRITFDQQCSIPSTTIDVTLTANSTSLTSNQSNATNYQWIDCHNGNSPIIGATNQSYSPTNSGSYAVEITLNGCIEQSECFQFSTLGLGNVPKSSLTFNFYPNPTMESLTIEHSDTQAVFVSIINLQGKILIQEQVLNGDKIDLRNLKAGNYLIRVQTDSMSQIHSMIKL